MSQKMLPERPKRPLSAYNIFFREARHKLLQHLPDKRKRGKKACYYSKRARHGKIGFEDLARTIGGMWKTTSQEERIVYNEQAVEDRKRYDREMTQWKSNAEEAKEALQVEKRAKVSTLVHDNDKASFGTQEKIQELSVAAEFPPKIAYPQHATRAHASNVQGKPIKQQVEDQHIDGTMDPIPVLMEALKSIRDTENLTSLIGFSVNALSTPPTTESTYLTSESILNIMSSAKPEDPTAATANSKNSNSVKPLNALLVHASRMKCNAGEHTKDPLSPTITPDYTHCFSWLASRMGKDSTALFIEMFKTRNRSGYKNQS